MSRCVTYCQARLGGTIEVGDGGDPRGLRQRVIEIETKLREAGFRTRSPSDTATLLNCGIRPRGGLGDSAFNGNARSNLTMIQPDT